LETTRVGPLRRAVSEESTLAGSGHRPDPIERALDPAGLGRAWSLDRAQERLSHLHRPTDAARLR
jgi:hypothetical protein